MLLTYNQLLSAHNQLLTAYTQLNQLYSEMNKTADELAIKAYVLKEAVVVTPDPSFSPPVSMYKAIKIALDNHGWNVTTLKGMIVGAHLDYLLFDSWGYEVLKEVTEPVADYSPLQNETGTYRYIWQVAVGMAGNIVTIPPADLCLIDASNGEIFPTGLQLLEGANFTI